MSKGYITFDCETDPFKFGRAPRPFVWGAFDGATFQTWEDTGDFLGWLAGQDVIAYAHNGGRFDFHHFLKRCPAQEITVINGRVAEIRYGAATLRDSWLILPIPLAAYHKDAIDYWKLEAAARGRHWQEILSYLEGDCRYLFELVGAFRRVHGLPLTLASAAFKDLVGGARVKGREAWDEKIRPWYHGGRVEALRRGRVQGPIHVRDIRSAYPWAMAHAVHPWGFGHAVGRGAPPGGFRPDGLYKVEARVDRAFPVQGETKLAYPGPDREEVYHVTGHEVIAALELGLVRSLRCVEWRHWDETRSFPDFVARWYGVKAAAEQAGDAAGRLVAKLTLNSAYGKLAADPRRYGRFRLVPWASLRDLQAEGWKLAADWGLDGAIVRRPLDLGERRYYNVAPAASITGAVRAKLLRAVAATRAAGGDVVYLDTDCIHATGGPPPVDVGPALGQWSDEGTAEAGWYAARKVYALQLPGGKWKTACKGARLDAAAIRKVAEGRPVNWSQDAPSYRLSGLSWVSRIVALDSEAEEV